jgi:hypothetical protein
MKRLGPELKKPEMKVPPVLRDLYLDLRDRRLLPLLGLVLVAIVAVPFLLAEGSEEPTVRPAGGGPAIAEGNKQASLTVVRSAPGLRDYRRRLRRRSPTNPFKQRYTSPVLKGAKLGSESSTSESSSQSVTEEQAPAAPPAAPPVIPGTGGGQDTNGDGIPDYTSLYTYVLDLQITRIETKPDGSREKTGPTKRTDVKAPTALPGEKAPVVTYLGLGAKEPRLPMFLISSEVTAIYGEGECIAGVDRCELITLKRGFPVTFVYGENDVRYKINLLEITPVRVDPPK